MEGVYEVTDHGRTIGQVKLKRQGLYYSVSCRCSLPQQENYVLELRCDENRLNLGILYPVEHDLFGLDMRIPAKRFGQGSPRFYLLSKSDQEGGIALNAPLPTQVLQQLECCRLLNADGRYCLVLQREKNI